MGKYFISILVLLLALVVGAVLWIQRGETIQTPLGDLTPPDVDFLNQRDELEGYRGDFEDFQEQGY